MVGPVTVASMINSQVVAEDDVPSTGIGRVEEREEMRVYAIVDRMQVPDVERVKRAGKFFVKVSREEGVPGVVAEMYNSPAGILQLSDQIVLVNGRACKVGSCIDEGGQSACSQALEALQSGRRRIRNEGQEEGILRLSDSGVPEDRQRVVKVVLHLSRLFLCPWYCEIVAQSIYNDDDGFVKPLGMPAASLC